MFIEDQPCPGTLRILYSNHSGEGEHLYLHFINENIRVGTWRDLSKVMIFQRCQGLSLNLDLTENFMLSLEAS